MSLVGRVIGKGELMKRYGYWVFGLVTLLVTYGASRGNHSQLHMQLAHVAMGLESVLIVGSVLCLFLKKRALHKASLIISLMVGFCFVAVFATDNLKGVPWWKFAVIKIIEAVSVAYRSLVG